MKLTLKERLIIATVIFTIIGTIAVFVSRLSIIGAFIGCYGYQFLAHWLCKRFKITWL